MVSITIGDAAGVSSLRFANHTYNVALSENAPRGTSVVTTVATFTDGSSGRITYSFASGNEDNTFDIMPGTGECSLVLAALHLSYNSPKMREYY